MSTSPGTPRIASNPRSWKRQKSFSLGASEKASNLPPCSSQTHALQNCERIQFCCFKPLSLWYLCGSPRKRTQRVTWSPILRVGHNCIQTPWPCGLLTFRSQGAGYAQKPCVPPTVFHTQTTVQDLSRLSPGTDGHLGLFLWKIQAAFLVGVWGTTQRCHLSDKSPGNPEAQPQKNKNNEQSQCLCYFPSTIVTFSNGPGEEVILTDFPCNEGSQGSLSIWPKFQSRTAPHGLYEPSAVAGHLKCGPCDPGTAFLILFHFN